MPDDTPTEISTSLPGDVMHILMPNGLSGRFEHFLATFGLRLYLAPVKDGRTYLVGLDAAVPAARDKAWTLPEVLDAYEAAVAHLADKPVKPKRHRAPIDRVHADGSICRHKVNTRGKPAEGEDCPGLTGYKAVCSCGT
ncbi:hypothetical protein OG339_48590 (plasmid) [Streptosporangium sp. NBC_01495]|uniref:hypothetical protein n=1 Tax=Streptosporangium sp. NBC_01495 TaxID=2903899 RepID=UPI002E3705C1|nr:hypothetical protein [Streptosporangium sp. NBC_01495]